MEVKTRICPGCGHERELKFFAHPLRVCCYYCNSKAYDAQDITRKRCADPSCLQVLPLSSFGKMSKNPDGHAAKCAACARKAGRKQYWKDPEKVREKARIKDRKAYWSDPEKHRERGRADYWKDPEKSRERNREKYRKDPDKGRAKGRRHYWKDPEKSRELARKSARARYWKDPEKGRKKEAARYKVKSARKRMRAEAYLAVLAEMPTRICPGCGHEREARFFSHKIHGGKNCYYCKSASYDPNDVEHKRCGNRDCRKILPLEAFGAHAQSRDGLRNNCKECERRTAEEYFKANPEKCRASWRLYQARHPETVKASCRGWRARNPEKTAVINHVNYWKDPEASRERGRRSYQRGADRRRALKHMRGMTAFAAALENMAGLAQEGSNAAGNENHSGRREHGMLPQMRRVWGLDIRRTHAGGSRNRRGSHRGRRRAAPR